MVKGWIRAYKEENDLFGINPYSSRPERAKFRKSFKTDLKKSKSSNSDTLATLKWDSKIDLPNGLSKQRWTKVDFNSKVGYVLTNHLVEIGYISSDDDEFYCILTRSDGKKKKLLWGDLVQIIDKEGDEFFVRARGNYGKVHKNNIDSKSLMEFYFIDVAQGDGVLLKTPNSEHLLIDGGLERKSQQTGKNAADFVDWKFFIDYGGVNINLKGLMASHSDTDHFGGLHDLVRVNELSQRELDCQKVNIDKFYHPGLSRWRKNSNATLKHYDGLGSKSGNYFVQLLSDRASAEEATNSNSEEQLSPPWSWFIRDVLKNNKKTKFESVFVEKENLDQDATIPELWGNNDYSIKILAPVTKSINGFKGLKDLGNKGKNSNGHSICLRVDYGKSRILLTGDLNKKSMNWIMDCYGDKMGYWACDVAKACHHGSDDISFKFLEELKAAATIISSGDAEGHAHPRPDIVAASAVTGYKNIDRRTDKLITPLVYMTEVERSVSLGALNQLEIEGLPLNNGDKLKKNVLMRNLDVMSKDLQDSLEDDTKAMEDDMENNKIKVNFNASVPIVPFGTRKVSKRAWNSKIMEKNHYGLVNVRTDGKTIMCATMDETASKWIIHSFSARF